MNFASDGLESLSPEFSRVVWLDDDLLALESRHPDFDHCDFGLHFVDRRDVDLCGVDLAVPLGRNVVYGYLEHLMILTCDWLQVRSR